MSERFPDGFTKAVDRVNEVSDKALYPYLDIAILGPYIGDCHAYLEEFKLQLREKGFEGASLASDGDSNIPDDWDGTESEYWYRDSIQFMDENDIAIFVFMANELRRRYLPDRAFDEDGPTERTGHPSGLNNSIIVELNDWVEMVDEPEERTLVIFEKLCVDEAGGSILEGKVDYSGLDDRDIDTHNIEQAVSEASSKCSNIAMGHLKPELQRRYLKDRF